mgnify:CR=1 FL=1
MADLLMKMPTPYEPKRVNRFIVRFHSSLGINEWYVSSAARPSAKIKSVEIPPVIDDVVSSYRDKSQSHQQSELNFMGIENRRIRSRM